MVSLPKGVVRNKISLPAGYGRKVTIDGKRTTYMPKVEVTVLKDKWGRYTVVEKGHRLTPAEKRLGLKRTRSKEAQFIKKQFEETGPRTSMRKIGGAESRRFRAWEVNAVKGWVDTSKKSFIGKDTVGRTGEMEQLMKSLDGTTAAVNNDWSFMRMWKKLNTEQKLELMDMLQDVDWDSFWQDYVDSDGTMRRMPDEDRQTEGLELIMSMFQAVM